jgi:hypothetical protein
MLVVAWESLTIPRYSKELNPIPLGLRVWIEPNVPQIGYVTEGSFYTEPPIPWACVNNAHYNPIKYEQAVHTYIN